MPMHTRLPGLFKKSAVAVACATASLLIPAWAAAQNLNTVFVIAMENHNWTQPATTLSP